MNIQNNKPFKNASIKLMVFDIDGVMTDGRLYYDKQGEAFKVFNVQDGYGLKKLIDSGIRVAIITGRKSDIVACRAKDLGINDVYQGIADKWEQLKELLKKYNLNENQAGYMGDDLIDEVAMTKVSLAVAPANARPEILKIAHYVTDAKGGEGAVRELCDWLIEYKNNHAV